MFYKIKSATNLGLETIGIDVEINIANRGLPVFEIVGLPSKSISESKERIKTAIVNSKLEFPAKRIVINLAPADVPKEGSCYDLPMAVGILSSTTKCEVPKDALFFGELSLDGTLRHTKGALLLSLFAKERGVKNIFVPKDSANEAAIIQDVNVYPVESLKQLVDYFLGHAEISPAEYKEQKTIVKKIEFDMKEILGQEQAKRAAEIAAAGGHNFLMVGSPGSGKTMLARAIPGILPAALVNIESSLTDLAITIDEGIPWAASIQHRHTTLDGYSYPIALNPLGGNVGIGTTTFDGSAAGVLAIGNGTAPGSGTANQSYIWSEDGDTEATSNLWVMDEAGNATEISPHDSITNEWIFYSKNVNTGRELKVRMEQLVKFIDEQFNTTFVEEYQDGILSVTTESTEPIFEGAGIDILDTTTESTEPVLTLNESGDVITEEIAEGLEMTTDLLSTLTKKIKATLTWLGMRIEDGVAYVREIVTDKIIAKEADIQRIRVQEFEIVDKQSGDIYCTWLEGGEWVKEQGLCDDVVNVVINEVDEPEPTPILETTTPSDEPILEILDTTTPSD